MVKFKVNKNVEIELAEPTKEALERFMAQPTFSIFFDEETKESIRQQLKGKLKDW